ncbi:MAG: hypothetical protein Q9O62_02045 [Ardenticatenia bacterium]|nr:hypothetical protein [Ardenticatenia bacterium]
MATWEIRQNEQAVARAQTRWGKFILATNALDAEALPADTILQAYKGQAVGPEGGFRCLKAPFFFADSLIMGLALLVYALAERAVHQDLVARGEYIPNQVGKPTQRPTRSAHFPGLRRH